MAKAADKPSKTWDITVNNYTDADVALLQSWEAEVSKMVVAKEVGEKGTPHLQGRITFKRTYRFSALTKLAPKWHWEKTMAKQDFLYCKKQGSEVIIDINNSKQGERSDLAVAVELVKKRGASAVAEELPETFVKYHRGLTALQGALEKPRDTAPEVHVRWGEPGSGKTRFVYDNHPHEEIWVKPAGDWFDGYVGQEVALFDDFYGSVKYCEFLKLLDRYPMRVPVKGGFVQWRPRVIYITSNAPPEEWYKSIADKRALLRRITSITKLGDAEYSGHENLL